MASKIHAPPDARAGVWTWLMYSIPPACFGTLPRGRQRKPRDDPEHQRRATPRMRLNSRARSAIEGARADGLVAEWLRRGLQILAPRFDSGRGLHFPEPSVRIGPACDTVDRV